MTQPVIEFANTINPSTVAPSPGYFPKATVLAIVAMCVRPLGSFKGVSVVWATDPRPMLGDASTQEQAWIVVSVPSDSGVGNEELRTQYNTTTSRRESLLVAQRQFTLTLRAFSLDPGLEATDILRRVRFYVNTASVRSLMVPYIALVDYNPIQTYTDRTSEGRSLLAAALDLKMAYVEAADPCELGSQDVIETAHGTGTLLT